jgi:hypothetical protein
MLTTGSAYAFAVIPYASTTDVGTPYDTQSLMHYKATHFGKKLANGTQLQTIYGHNGNDVPAVDPSRLTTNDARMVNLVYKNCRDSFANSSVSSTTSGWLGKSHTTYLFSRLIDNMISVLSSFVG